MMVWKVLLVNADLEQKQQFVWVIYVDSLFLP